jgi:protein-disulfide isomerase-like protein with CxxC motif
MSREVEILCFTDPFCSWCWATEPSLLTLRERYRDQLDIRWVMGGLVKDMSAFFDSSNGIGTTAEVAPHWRMVAEHGPLTTRELSEILGEGPEQDLRERATQGKIIAVELRGGTMWSLPGDATVGRADHSSRSAA